MSLTTTIPPPPVMKVRWTFNLNVIWDALYVAYDKHGSVVCRINWWANIFTLLKCDKYIQRSDVFFFSWFKSNNFFCLLLPKYVNHFAKLSVCGKGTVQESCQKFKKTFLPLHTELLSVESCDICVIEIPHSCVQITHWTHARCSVSSRNCWQRTTKSSAHFLPHQPELQSFLCLC